MANLETTQTSKYPQGTSEYIAFLDECGDHSLRHIDKDFPVFLLSLVIVKRREYLSKILPEINKLKIKYWDHEGVNLHSRDIRRLLGSFSFLKNNQLHSHFMNDLTQMMKGMPYEVIFSSIHKNEISTEHKNKSSLEITLVDLFKQFIHWMSMHSQTHIVIIAESRGKKEDRELKTVTNNLVPLINPNNYSLPILFHSKQTNIAGVQIADLCAYPAARKILNPGIQNVPFSVVEEHIYNANTD